MSVIELLLDGKYEVIRKIGEGGNGSVYQVYDHRLERYAALKHMFPVGEMSTTELEFLKQLRHPALPVVLDYFKQGDSAYLVMEYIEGVTLTQYRKCFKEADQEKAVKMILQLCDVLQYMHQYKQPVIHRDIKPDNILLDEEGKLHLIDFGAALFLHRKRDKTGAGTDGYAAPEQLLREEAAQVDERADIYGIGATFYFLLTGEVPTGNGEMLPRIRTYSRTFSQTVEKIIQKATEPEKRNRYVSVNELQEELIQYEKKDKLKAVLSFAIHAAYYLIILTGGFVFCQFYKMAEIAGDSSYRPEILRIAGIIGITVLIKECIYYLRRIRVCRRVKDICLTEKSGIGLLLSLFIVLSGIVVYEPLHVRAEGTVKENLSVAVREESYKVLVRYDAVYEMKNSLLLEIDKKNFNPQKVYKLALMCREEETGKVMERNIYLKLKQP